MSLSIDTALQQGPFSGFKLKDWSWRTIFEMLIFTFSSSKTRHLRFVRTRQQLQGSSVYSCREFHCLKSSCLGRRLHRRVRQEGPDLLLVPQADGLVGLLHTQDPAGPPQQSQHRRVAPQETSKPKESKSQSLPKLVTYSLQKELQLWNISTAGIEDWLVDMKSKFQAGNL